MLYNNQLFGKRLIIYMLIDSQLFGYILIIHC